MTGRGSDMSARDGFRRRRGRGSLVPVLGAVLLSAPTASAAAQAAGSSADAQARPPAPRDEAAAAQAEFDRREIGRLLAHPRVRETAREAGVDLRRIETSVSRLSRSELRNVGRRAERINDALEPGADEIAIPTSTVIIGLLVLIVLLLL